LQTFDDLEERVLELEEKFNTESTNESTNEIGGIEKAALPEKI